LGAFGVAPAADAAWLASGPGAAAAKAGHLPRVTGLACDDRTVTWSPLEVAGAVYLVQWSTDNDFEHAHEVTVSDAQARVTGGWWQAQVRVQARIGDAWHGEFSEPVRCG
jgi:hypothetical protein